MNFFTLVLRVCSSVSVKVETGRYCHRVCDFELNDSLSCQYLAFITLHICHFPTLFSVNVRTER